jgi:acetyl esterase/lipase
MTRRLLPSLLLLAMPAFAAPPVPLVEAQQVAAELKKRNVPVESVIFPDEGHGFRKIPNRVRSTVEIVRWFERYLAPAAPRPVAP